MKKIIALLMVLLIALPMALAAQSPKMSRFHCEKSGGIWGEGCICPEGTTSLWLKCWVKTPKESCLELGGRHTTAIEEGIEPQSGPIGSDYLCYKDGIDITEQAKEDAVLNKVKLTITIEKSQVRGLENAMLRVRNQEQKLHLQLVMDNILEKQRTRLNRLENLEFGTDMVESDGDIVTEIVTATGIEEQKFLGLFKMKRNAKFSITEEGELIKHKKFFDFLFGEVGEEE